MWRWFSSSIGLVRYGFVPTRVHFIFLKARIFPYLSCWNADFPWGTQWERCLDFFQGSVAALIFLWWRWRGCQLKIFEGWLHRWWFQNFTPWEYTCYQVTNGIYQSPLEITATFWMSLGPLQSCILYGFCSPNCPYHPALCSTRVLGSSKTRQTTICSRPFGWFIGKMSEPRFSL